jgi:hypothetical protein
MYKYILGYGAIGLCFYFYEKRRIRFWFDLPEYDPNRIETISEFHCKFTGIFWPLPLISMIRHRDHRVNNINQLTAEDLTRLRNYLNRFRLH